VVVAVLAIIDRRPLVQLQTAAAADIIIMHLWGIATPLTTAAAITIITIRRFTLITITIRHF
jgi:hypothetical protein